MNSHVFRVPVVALLVFCTSTAVVGRQEQQQHGDGDHAAEDAANEARMAGRSASFTTLRDNVIGVLANLPPSVVEGDDKTQLVNAFIDIFKDYEAKTVDELQPLE
jgi:hypothetical protein